MHSLYMYPGMHPFVDFNFRLHKSDAVAAVRRQSKSRVIFHDVFEAGSAAHPGFSYANSVIRRLICRRFDSICFADFDASAARDFTDYKKILGIREFSLISQLLYVSAKNTEVQ